MFNYTYLLYIFYSYISTDSNSETLNTLKKRNRGKVKISKISSTVNQCKIIMFKIISCLIFVARDTRITTGQYIISYTRAITIFA